MTTDERMALTREDDRRMSAVETQVALVAQQQQTLTASVGEVKALVSQLDTKFDTMLERLIREHAEPKATPAGRQMVEITTANRSSINVIDARVESLESWRAEMLGGVRVLRLGVGLSSFVSAVAIVVSALHAAHLL